MPGQTLQTLSLLEERSSNMPQDMKIMLKVVEFLLQDQLITPEEKYRLTRLIKRDDVI